jgi:hypothetical protein
VPVIGDQVLSTLSTPSPQTESDNRKSNSSHSPIVSSLPRRGRKSVKPREQ